MKAVFNWQMTRFCIKEHKRFFIQKLKEDNKKESVSDSEETESNGNNNAPLDKTSKEVTDTVHWITEQPRANRMNGGDPWLD